MHMTHMISRCKEEYGYSDEDMVILERELKRYLILSLVKDAGRGMYSKDVDNLWHTIRSSLFEKLARNSSELLSFHIQEQ